MHTSLLKSAARTLAATLAVFSAVVRVHGYAFVTDDDGFPVKWTSATIPMRIMADNSAHLSDGKTRAGVIQAAMTDTTTARGWNQYLVTTQFSPAIAAVGSGVDNDQVNEIFFSATPYDQTWDSNTLAVTTGWSRGEQRTEADIIINTNFSWDSYRGTKGSKVAYDLRRVVMHELGHVLGLDHPDEHGQSVSAIMNSVVSDVDTFQADDIAGAQALYGVPGVKPANDNFASAIAVTLSGGTASVSGSNVAATKETGEPNHGNDPGGRSVWWKVTPSSAGALTVDTAGSQFDTTLGIYTGSSVSSLSSLAQNDDVEDGVIRTSSATVNVSAGTTYYIAVDGFGGGSGPVTLNFTLFQPAPPAITNLPSQVNLTTGDTLTLSPAVSGTQPITYQWNKDGNPIAGATGLSYTHYSVTTGDAGQYTLTATNSVGSTTSAGVPVSVHPPIVVARLVADPFRPRVYAVQQSGTDAGVVLVLDPATGQPSATIPVGQKPCDVSISADGSEMLVICAASQNLSVINLNTLQVTGTIPLPEFGQWDVTATSAHVKHGAGNIIYYSDGTWAPIMRVLNRSNGTILQRLMLDATAPNNNGSFGFGDFAITGDKTALIAWGQYGWTAGSAGSAVARFGINADGTLTLSQTGTFPYPIFGRDPLDTPVLMTADGSAAFVKIYRFDRNSVTQPTATFPLPVYAISPQGELASTATGISQTGSGNVLYSFSPNVEIQAITGDYAHLVYFDPVARQLGAVDLTQHIDFNAIGLIRQPADGAFIQPPGRLQWAPQAGVFRFRVYLGTSAGEVDSAVPTSAEYLGEVHGISITLGTPPAPGTTYYWRVDAVTDAGVTKGSIFHFTTASIVTDTRAISRTTVAGDPSQSASIALTAGGLPQNWTAGASVPWIHLASTSGTTPANLQATFDASTLPPGVSQGSIAINSADGSFNIPVELTVDPLAVTVMRSAPDDEKVYAISEENAADYTGYSRAYLVEISATLKRITRAVRVGTGATDLAIHRVDGCIYVTNWRIGALLAVDVQSFTVKRSYPFAVFAEAYGSRDAYRVSAGAAGRIMVEPEDQWITLSLYDTVNGTAIATDAEREGGGTFDPQGRCYFHGDDNISNASLHKFDTTGGVFQALGSARPNNIVSYYGDRTVVMTADGHRVFWNGYVFDENLNPGWNVADIVYCASLDGSLAFAYDKVYDVRNQRVLGSMPVSTRVSAYNNATQELVLQGPGGFQFYGYPATAAPVILVQPTGRLVTAGSGATFAVVAAASPAPSYQWRRNGVPVAGANASSFTISAATLALAGSYDVVVANASGSVVSSPAQLGVQPLADDFNGDGQRDLLWSNATTGERRFWFLNGTAYGSEASLGAVPPEWRIAGTADFNRDGYSDILWINRQTGEILVWLMNGPAYGSSVSLGIAPAGWTLVGAGDFNGDGSPDLVWQDYSTGECMAWLMDGTTYSSSVSLGTVPPSWRISGVADFDRDGKADILWTDTSTGTALIWVMNGSAYAWTAVVGPLPSGLRIAAVDDYNGDGWPDLMLTNMVTNERSIWLMNGATHVGTVSLGIIPPEWTTGLPQKPIQSAKLDFNGDAQSDLLWENANTGEHYAWLMNGTSLASSAFLGTLPTQWRIAGSGDFNGDGQPDLIWENTSTGEHYVWLMNGTNFVSSVYLGTISTDWRIAATGDFNGDAQNDLIWENTTTGEHYVWLMNGTNFVSSVSLGVLPAAWRIADTGDFNGDGQPDIVWENTSTGERYIWLMNGTSFASAVFLGVISPDWSIAAVADYNGDGQPDIVWQNTTTGERYVWLMNGTNFASSVFLGIVPAQWRIAP